MQKCITSLDITRLKKIRYTFRFHFQNSACFHVVKNILPSRDLFKTLN